MLQQSLILFFYFTAVFIIFYYTYFEVTHKVLLAADGNVGRFAHVVAAVKPANEVASLRDAEHRRRHAVYCHYVTYT